MPLHNGFLKNFPATYLTLYFKGKGTLLKKGEMVVINWHLFPMQNCFQKLFPPKS